MRISVPQLFDGRPGTQASQVFCCCRCPCRLCPSLSFLSSFFLFLFFFLFLLLLFLFHSSSCSASFFCFFFFLSPLLQLQLLLWSWLRLLNVVPLSEIINLLYWTLLSFALCTLSTPVLPSILGTRLGLTIQNCWVSSISNPLAAQYGWQAGASGFLQNPPFYAESTVRFVFALCFLIDKQDRRLV